MEIVILAVLGIALASGLSYFDMHAPWMTENDESKGKCNAAEDRGSFIRDD